jgi:hypothetical protein
LRLSENGANRSGKSDQPGDMRDEQQIKTERVIKKLQRCAVL